ncbi:MAG: helix-turn-helix domain-containing protein [Gemmatimonadetes bacterium]|jgi:excisionase family DNA binding protein|nr:helix-turn-helix domain-containing protein [Gemmatimonadota bacterium]
MRDRDEKRGTLVDVLDLSEHSIDRVEAARSAARLRELAEGADLLVRGPGGETIPLPRGLSQLVAAVLEEVALGRSVGLVSGDAEVSTSTAARLLGVSRPHVVKLIDAGLLPGRRAGTHRRVRLTDLLAYQQRTAQRHARLDELMEESEALGLYAPERQQA